MFKKTLKFSDLKSDPAAIAEMKDGDVIQIIHRGQEIKVMMTQEYFFSLMARLEKGERTARTTSYDPEKMMQEFDLRLRKMADFLGNNEQTKTKIGKMAK